MIEAEGLEGIDTTGVDIPVSVISVLFDGKKSPRVRSFKSGSIQADIPGDFTSGQITVTNNSNTDVSEETLYRCSDTSFLHKGDIVSINVKVTGMRFLLHKSEFASEPGKSDVYNEYDIDSTVDYSFSCNFGKDFTTRFISSRSNNKDSLIVEYGDILNGGAYRALTMYSMDTSSNTLKEFSFFRGLYQRYFGSSWERGDTDKIALKELPIVYKGIDSIYAFLDLSTRPDLLQDFQYSRFDGHSSKSYSYYKKENLVSLQSLQPNSIIQISLKFYK